MYWISIAFHLVLFGFFAVACSRRFGKSLTRADWILPGTVILFTALNDLGSRLEFNLWLRLMVEGSVVETLEAVLYLFTGIALVACAFRLRDTRAGFGYLFFGLLYVWFVFEEVSYGWEYLGIRNPGPTLAILMSFRIAPDIFALSPLGIFLKIVWLGSTFVLQVVIVGVLFSPDHSLRLYRHPRQAWAVIRARYSGAGVVLLASRALVLIAVSQTPFFRLVGTGVFGDELLQAAFSMTSVAFVFGIVVPRTFRGGPTSSTSTGRRFRVIAGFIVAVWALSWTVMVGGRFVNSLPVEIEQSALAVVECASAVEIRHVLSYPQGDVIVVRGVAANRGDRFIESILLRYRTVDSSGQTLATCRIRVPLGKPERMQYAGIPIGNPVHPLKPGKGQYFRGRLPGDGVDRVRLVVDVCKEFEGVPMEGRAFPNTPGSALPRETLD